MITRFCWIYLLKHKSDFYDFQAYVKRLLSSKIKAVLSDWDGEWQGGGGLCRLGNDTGARLMMAFCS
jgi:hypothetical protein